MSHAHSHDVPHSAKAVDSYVATICLLGLGGAAVVSVMVIAGLIFTIGPSFGYLQALGGVELSFDAYRMVFAAPGFGRMLFYSSFAAISTGLLSLVIVCSFLAFTARPFGGHGERGHLIINSLSPLLSVPHAAVAFSLALLLAPSGEVFRWLSPWLTGFVRPPDWLIVGDKFSLTLLLGLLVKEVPFLLLVSLAALEQLSVTHRLETALSLGRKPAGAWFSVVFPVLYPAIRLPIFAVIAYSASNVDMALILGPDLPPTLSVALLQWTYDPNLSAKFMATAGAVIQLLVVIGSLIIWRIGEWLVGKCARLLIVGRRLDAFDSAIQWFGVGVASILTVIGYLGIVVLIYRSFIGFRGFPDIWPSSFTLDGWVRAIEQLSDPLINTIGIGFASVVLALIVVVMLLECERLGFVPALTIDLTMYIPLIVPQFSFLFGLTILFETIQLPSGVAVVVVGHLIFVVPYIYLSLAGPWRRLSPQWDEAARVLGASSWKVLMRVRAPMLAVPIFTAMAIGFSVSVAQYLSTLLLGGRRVDTVTTEAIGLAGYSSGMEIAIWAVIQALLPAIAFGLLLRYRLTGKTDFTKTLRSSSWRTSNWRTSNWRSSNWRTSNWRTSNWRTSNWRTSIRKKFNG